MENNEKQRSAIFSLIGATVLITGGVLMVYFAYSDIGKKVYSEGSTYKVTIKRGHSKVGQYDTTGRALNEESTSAGYFAIGLARIIHEQC